MFHGWIVGGLDSAYNTVYHILQQAGATGKIEQMQEIWGIYTTPDITEGRLTIMEYEFAYNK